MSNINTSNSDSKSVKDVFTDEEANAAEYAALELEKMLVKATNDCDIIVLAMWETDHFELDVASFKSMTGTINNFMNYPVRYSILSHCHGDSTH